MKARLALSAAYFSASGGGIHATRQIAVEATGHWYWMIDEMEKAGHQPHLANPPESKKRMGKPDKHDALDAGGLAILLHNGTLPESWIPPGELRDVRELPRTRMALRDLRWFGCSPAMLSIHHSRGDVYY